ncbi:heme/hemin ABC transporter substrate-binding protein [Aestuariivita boseongensis]|uniref:heme/hemin ABC transporter substrate-binding protein n=1 Tax=Aestuariivita boseongensis TaxID=1470562 RepID=UPI0006806F3C|nr:ABC transporter substrate-binding protein [Aestuariivita boseongensis]
MLTRRTFGLALGAAALAPTVGHAVPARVLSIGGAVTETVFALGQGHRLVARDTTSTFPEAATTLPDVGYARALAPEGVLSVNPELIVAEEGAGPVETIDILRAADIPFVIAPDAYSAAGVAEKIRVVGGALDVADRAEALAQEVLGDIAAAQALSPKEERKRVLFILSAQGGRILASGSGTAADGMIALAGGENAITEFSGYKQLSDEAVAAAAPDVILMMDRGGDHGAPDEVLLNMPSILPTPAARDGAVIRMNGLYLLGFGPRTGQAVRDLNTALYGKA